MPNTFINKAKKVHSNTVCEGVLVTETKLCPSIIRLLLTDVIYINGMSLKSLPYTQRLSALRKEIIDRIHETKDQDRERIQQSPYKSIALRDCWPIDQLSKIRDSLIPSLTHACKGIFIIDAAAPYAYGDQPSRCWLWNR